MSKMFQTISGAELMDKQLEPIRFIVDSLIPQGLHILAGSPKIGKSWLVLWLCLKVANGEEIWNLKTEKGTTLYLGLEDSIARIQSRVKTLFYSFDFDIIDFINMLPEQKEKSVNSLKEALTLTDPQNSLNFMRHVKSPVTSLEKVVQANNNFISDYISFINDAEQYTDCTINWLGKTNLNISLKPLFTDVLLEKQSYKNYVIGKSLYDNKLAYAPKQIDIEIYMDLFLNVPCMYRFFEKHRYFTKWLLKEGMIKSINTAKHAIILSNVDNTFELIQHAFSLITEKDERQKYITNINKIASLEDSIKIQKFLCTEDIIKDLGSSSIKNKIMYLLWEDEVSHKEEFSNIWDAKYKKETVDISKD